MGWAMCRALWTACGSSDDPSPQRRVVEARRIDLGSSPLRIALGNPRGRLRVSVLSPEAEIVSLPSRSFDGGSVAVLWSPNECQEDGRNFVRCHVDVSKLDT